MAAICAPASVALPNLPVALEVQRHQRSKETKLAGQGPPNPEVGQVPAQGMGKDWGVSSNCARCGQRLASAGLLLLAWSNLACCKGVFSCRAASIQG